jgi:hypothetical protein
MTRTLRLCSGTAEIHFLDKAVLHKIEVKGFQNPPISAQKIFFRGFSLTNLGYETL